jgi:hypothetical protein
MPAAKIMNFSGMIPALDDAALPDTAASYANNVILGDGTVRGFRPMTFIRNIGLAPAGKVGAKKVFRIPIDPTLKPTTTFGQSTWLEFLDIDTDVLRSPVINDIYNRYYWTAPTSLDMPPPSSENPIQQGPGPRYLPLSYIQAGREPLLLGVPNPVAPGVQVIGGTATMLTTRAYCYAWRTAFGEEGPPGVATVRTGNADGDWKITMNAPTASYHNARDLSQTVIYRTVVSAAGVSTFFQVAVIGISQTVYVDALTDVVVTSHPQLESVNWTGPPALKGWVALPNGSFAGWTGADVWFSEPYRPHAWPVAYGVSCDSPIIGMGVHGQSLIVLTKGNPHVISGIRPSQMSQMKIPSKETCSSRASIVSTLDGVLFASQNGIAIATAGGIVLVTEKLIDKETWLREVDPYTLRAVKHGTAYLAFTAPATEGSGLMIDKPPTMFSWVDADAPIQNPTTDLWTGETLVVHSDKIWHFDPQEPAEEVNPFLWRSKLYEFPGPHNFAAAKVRFTILKPVTPLGNPDTALNMTLGTKYAVFRAYADDKLVFSKELQVSNKVFRLPAGFKAARWKFEIEGRVVVHSMEVATSIRELAKV